MKPRLACNKLYKLSARQAREDVTSVKSSACKGDVTMTRITRRYPTNVYTIYQSSGNKYTHFWQLIQQV